MVRDNRIKTFKFPTQTFSSTTTGSVVSDKGLNGEILDVFWDTGISGSVFLTNGETGEEFWRRNAPSGASISTASPRKFGESTTGSIAGAHQTNFNIADTLVLNIGSALSGTTASLDVSVRYR